MFISAQKYLFLTDNLAGILTGAIPSADIAEDLLTAYQKDKGSFIQYMKERFSQIKLELSQITFCTITTY